MPKTEKFMQTLTSDVYKELVQIAKERGLTIQELLRAVIIPDWLRENARKAK